MYGKCDVCGKHKEKRALLRTKREFFTELFGKRRSRQSGYHHKNQAGIHKLQALSPRRLVMHGAFSLYAKVFSKTQTSIFTPSDNIETDRKTVTCADLKSFCQEQFSVCEEISVGEKPQIESVLRSDVSVGVIDAKAVTGKLMLNGELNLKLLYLSNAESGEVEKLDYLLPFNKILDCDGIDENTINCVSCDVMSYDIRLKNDMLSEKPSVILEVKLCVTEEGYITREEEIVCDATQQNFPRCRSLNN